MNRADRQKAAVQALKGLGAWVRYDYEVDYDAQAATNAAPASYGDFWNKTTQPPPPPGPAWLRWLVGVDFLADVEVVDLAMRPVDDDDLVHLATLTELQVLMLDHTDITNAGLEHLKKLRKLECLSVQGTEVTDEGLEVFERVPNLYEGNLPLS